jgi:hypothetical protein
MVHAWHTLGARRADEAAQSAYKGDIRLAVKIGQRF